MSSLKTNRQNKSHPTFRTPLFSTRIDWTPVRWNASLPMSSARRMSRAWVILFFLAAACSAQTNDTPALLKAMEENLGHLDARLTRQMNELLWFQRLGDVALVDKVRFTGPPPRATNKPAPPSGSNEVLVSALTFLPRERSPSSKLPLIVMAHGEVHGNVARSEERRVGKQGR